MMKNITKFAIVIVFITAIGVSYFAGGYIKQKKLSEDILERCDTCISFAIDKAETKDLSDAAVMDALISNIYAAYRLCDNYPFSQQIHDLWNELMNDKDGYIGNEAILIERLQAISESIKSEI